MQPTKWWKCDLQVATPAWKFELPPGDNFDFMTDGDRKRFADLYIHSLKARGVEVIALADHNTHEWIDVVKAAGERHGVIVFPGCEVTTGSGADGIHLLVIGDRNKTGRDFDQLLAGNLGFDVAHPRFHDNGEPASSAKSLTQILDDLPDDFLVIAPHALTDNGIASMKTARGDIRWKALHHERLNAIDPGDCCGADGPTWNDRFRRRDLDQFPCVKDIAFVATSDAYSLDKLGCRFSWIRMAEPSLEALRQAFLDHEARIICSWDARLAGYPHSDPNEVRHGWIKSITLGPNLGNSRGSLTIPLRPGLNAIIGGRGSGKSTVVAAARQIYSSTANLPEKIKTEADAFADAVFANAELSATHLLANSQEEQTAKWTLATGSLTRHAGGDAVTTSFKVRVVNQKELFERVAKDKDDAFAASRSFLGFVDESLGFNKTASPAADSWWRRFDGATAAWTNAMKAYQLLLRDLAQMPTIKAKVAELEGQLAAFDSDEAKARRQNNRERQQERDALADDIADLRQWLDRLPVEDEPEPGDPVSPQPEPTAETEFAGLRKAFAKLAKDATRNVRRVRDEARAEIEAFIQRRDASGWWQSVQDAEADARAYFTELQKKGIDPKAYGSLQQLLKSQTTLLKQLATKEAERDAAASTVAAAWDHVSSILQERLDERTKLLEEVGSRSGTLKFTIAPRLDVTGWSQAVRGLLNLRSDAFLDDVPQLGVWLWAGPAEGRAQRWAAWRLALASGDFVGLAGAGLRPGWLKKLQSLDETLRLRLAAEVADDVVTMKFLRDRGDPTREEDWQNITEGSPGQRTAAMLGFVLHHGVEPLVLDQPDDDLDTEWISNLVVKELRASRWKRQIIVITHNANIPVNGDADQVVVLENVDQTLRVRCSGTDGNLVHHCGPIELRNVRTDIQNIMEGGISAFVRREKKYNNEMRDLRINL